MPRLSVIVPVLDERENIQPLLCRLDSALEGIDWEVVFVDDDSLDGTADLCVSIARRNPRVRILRRIGRTGLASACVEGMLATCSPYLAVMDGDLQHDERILPQMLKLAESQFLDVVVASRRSNSGSMGEFPSGRVRLSNLGRWVSHLVTRCDLSDPMSGFFLVSRNFFEEVVRNLSQTGFKILLDVMTASRRPLRVAEVGYTFRNRENGESKLDASVGVDFLLLLADKLVGQVIPVRFVLYSLVGISGLIVHMSVLVILHLLTRQPLILAQVLATLVAMTWNFLLNNLMTYRDRKLRGWRRIVRGLLIYCAVCSIGAVANVSLTAYLTSKGLTWFAAGAGGMVLSSVWNYSVATVFTWTVSRHRVAARSTGLSSQLEEAAKTQYSAL